MPEPPPRKRFQIHLSTAIVLMFVAGALIWANTAKPYSENANFRREYFKEFTTVEMSVAAFKEKWQYRYRTDSITHYYGWPDHAYKSVESVLINTHGEILYTGERDNLYIKSSIVYNVLAALLILITTAIFSEAAIISFTATRKGPP